MRQNLIDGLPAFSAVAVLLVTAGIKALRIVPETLWYDFETISNIVLFGIAVVSFLCVGLPSKREQERHLGGTLSNLIVSAVTFPMNIAVFERVIDWKHPLNGLWGGYIAWGLWLCIQFLLLSGLAEQLLSWLQKFLTWGEQRTAELGGTFQAVVEAVKEHDKGIITIMTVSTVLWALYLTCKVLAGDTGSTLAEPDTLGKSMLLWLACVITGALIYITPSLFRRLKKEVEAAEQKKFLAVFGSAALLVVLLFALPILPDGATKILAVLAGTACLAVVVRKGTARTNPDPDPPPQDDQRFANPADIAVAVLAFLAIPLLLTGVTTALSEEGRVIVEGDKADPTTWLNFFEAFLNTANALLELLL